MERDLGSHTPPLRRGRLPRLYVAVWVVLSSMALTYLAMLSIRPDLAEGLGEQIAALAGVETQPEARLGQDFGDERARADIVALRQSLDALQRELAAMRTVISAREERDQAFAARLSAVEAQRVAENAVPLTTASVNRGPLDGPGNAGPDALPGRSVEGRVVEAPPPLPTRAPEPPPRRASAPQEAERVAAAPQARPTPIESDGPRGIQIATAPSVDALRISWMLMSERHKEILKRYEARFAPSASGSGPAYRLIAGPIESTSAANRVCSELRARRVTCGVSAYIGEPL